MDKRLDRSWMPQGVCASIDMDMHHPTTDHPNQPRPVKVCQSCPVIHLCEQYVMTMEQGWPARQRCGIWAGMFPQQRAEYEPQWLAEQEGSAA